MPGYQSEINQLQDTSASNKSMINLPPRYDNAKSGSQIGKEAINLSGQTRDNYFLNEILLGNIPDYVRNLVPVRILDKGNLLEYYVSPDVLSVGSNEDYLRISLNGRSAKILLDQINCTLPTKKMSNDIFYSADFRLNPQPMGASSSMTNTQTLINHNAAINNQTAGRDFTLLTGHKKDIVIDKNLLLYKKNIAIYGFFYKTGQPIQGPGVQYSAHNILYQDYSHSIRLCSRNAILNNQPVDLFEVLNDPNFAYLISEQGPYNAVNIYN